MKSKKNGSVNNHSVDFNKLSQQLRCPFGDDAEEMAENMFQTNSNIITTTIKQLKLKANDRVLEVGFANGKHLPSLMEQADNIHYQGVEISADMVTQATVNNQTLVDNQQAKFIQVVENEPLPFAPATFDKIFSANTVYFWHKPQVLINELYQLLTEGGQLAISFIGKEFAEKMPIDQSIFNFYHADEVVSFMEQAGFADVYAHEFSEEATSKFGGVFTRPFFVVKGVKVD